MRKGDKDTEYARQEPQPLQPAPARTSFGAGRDRHQGEEQVAEKLQRIAAADTDCPHLRAKVQLIFIGFKKAPGATVEQKAYKCKDG